ncbi:MAG: dTDP-glucose 4,6-dehydratase [Thermoplasmata archaeon]
MKVLITGGAGFIGVNLAQYWHREHPGDELTVFDLLTYAGRRESLVDLDASPGFRFIRGDVTNLEQVIRALDGTELVVHLAAETHNDRAIGDPLQFVRTNMLGTATLLEACRATGVKRFHHVSTDEVYGSLELTDARRFTEESPYRPRGPYSASKAGSDHLVRAWFETYGMPVTISNCGNNFGPFQFPEKLISLTITRLLRGLPAQLYGDGHHVRDWIFVEDHCSAIDLIAHKGTVGTTYLVSAENELSNRQITERLLQLCGRGPKDIEFIPDRMGHDRRYALDPGRLKSQLGWSARHDFDSALRNTVEWYRTHESWWGPLVARGG